MELKITKIDIKTFRCSEVSKSTVTDILYNSKGKGDTFKSTIKLTNKNLLITGFDIIPPANWAEGFDRKDTFEILCEAEPI